MIGGTASRRPAGEALRWIGLVGIASITVLRCVTTFAPALYFDVDPALDPNPLAGLGPAGSLALDALMLLAAASALLGETRSGRRVRVAWIVVALLPGVTVIAHGWNNGPDLWRGMNWLSAMVAMVAAAHLARDRCQRITLIAVLLGVLGALLVRGGVQVWREHPQTVAEFERTKEQFLAARGWEPDSSSARIYERRLRQARPRGWFVTENVYASFMACGFVAMLGLAVTAFRTRAATVLQVGTGVTCALALGGLIVAGSKGAVLAAAGGAVLVCAPAFSEKLRAWLMRHGGTVLVLFVASAVIGVIVRGTVVPESLGGERSLLFRWHYLVGSMRILSDDPLTGVGAAGYQDAYVLHREPRSPEEVSSAHNVLLDWLCALGVLGAVWGAFILARLKRALHAHAADTDERDCSRAVLLACTVVAICALLPAMSFEAHTLDEPARLVRTGGVVAFILIAALIGQLLSGRPLAPFRWAVACAAATLLVHGMIEITFVQPESTAWCLLWFAVAAPAAAGDDRRRSVGYAAAAVLAVVAGGVWWWGARPAAIQQRQLAAAAQALRSPDDTAGGQARQRLEAARLLRIAYDAWPVDPRPLEAASFQALAASSLLEGEARITAVQEAARAADLARTHDTNSTIALRAAVYGEMARITGDPSFQETAISESEEIVRRDPHAIGSWRRYGDTLWEAGRRREAASAYRRALEADRNQDLDELKRLPFRDRALIESRLTEAEQTEGES